MPRPQKSRLFAFDVRTVTFVHLALFGILWALLSANVVLAYDWYVKPLLVILAMSFVACCWLVRQRAGNGK